MENKTKIKVVFKKCLCFIAAAVMLFSVLAIAGCSVKDKDGQNVTGLEKQVTFKIVYEDKTSKTVELNTQKETLALALEEAGIIEYEASGFYTVIDGVTADYNADGSWWCITKDGQMLNAGMNDLKIQDGESYEAVYTK